MPSPSLVDRKQEPCRATSSGLAIPTSSASFIGGVGHHDSDPGLGADVCDSPQGRTYSKSRNCRRQLTRRANAHNALLWASEFVLSTVAASECIALLALYQVRSPATPIIGRMPAKLIASCITMSSRKEVSRI